MLVKTDLEHAVGSIKKTGKDVKVPAVVEESIGILKDHLSDLSNTITNLYRIQRTIRTNEHRNMVTVKATEVLSCGLLS